MKLWRRVACAVLCFVLLGSNLSVAFATDGSIPTVAQEQSATEYTLMLTHYFKDGTENGLRVEERVTLTAADFVSGVCDLTRFARTYEQAPAETPASLSLDSFAEGKAAAEIAYTVQEGLTASLDDNGVVVFQAVSQEPKPDPATVPAQTETNPQPAEQPGAVSYALTLTCRFTDAAGNVADVPQTITLTAEDFSDNSYSVSAPQYEHASADSPSVTISLDSFDVNHKATGIVEYTVQEGWTVSAGEDGKAVFIGPETGDIIFQPMVRLAFQYSNTDDLAGANAAEPKTVELQAGKQEAEGKVTYTLDAYDLPIVDGFRIVLNPGELNQYVVSPPTGNETEAELKEKLQNGDFNVNVSNPNMPVYYCQEKEGENEHPIYKNIFSTNYNEAWNNARKLSADDFTAEVKGTNTIQGASQLTEPKLSVTLTEEQLSKALTDGLDITVYYCRNAAWNTLPTQQYSMLTNTYDAASNALSLTGTTNITGRTFQTGDQFTFDIKALDGAPAPKDNQGGDVTQVVLAPGSGKDASISFGTLQFTQSDMKDAQGSAVTEKTFRYEITEAEGQVTDMVYDTAKRTVEVTVTDDGGGVLTAAITSPQTDLVWNNRFIARANLMVTKTVAGNGGDQQKDFLFTVTLTDDSGKDISGDFSGLRFTLRHGEKKVITGIPVGTGYTVVEAEANQNGYVTVATGDGKGTIQENGSTVEFTNTRDIAPGKLTVTKTVTGFKGDKTKDFTFVVTLSDKTINGEYGEMTFVNGRAEFTLKHGERKTAEDLPAGVEYTVKEGDNEGYTVRKIGDTGEIPEGRTVYARFTNRKTNLDDQPKTGDDTKLELWAGLTVLCFLGAVVSLVVGKKRKNKYNR